MRILLIIGLIISAFGLRAPGATLTWTGAADSNFHNSLNWSPIATPDFGDTLNIDGTVNVSPAFTTTGQINWTGGNLQGFLTVATNGSLSLAGSGNKFFDGVITNAGTVTLTNNGYLLFNNADNAQLINLPGGLVDVQGDFNFFSNGSPSGLQIVNQGTFLKSAGSGICAISSGIPFYNSGSVVALSGQIDMQGGGTLAGTCITAAGAAVTFNAGTFALTSSAIFSGPGFVGIVSGSPVFSGTLATAMRWSGGSFGGSLSIATNGLFALETDSPKYLNGGITNAGTLALTNNGSLFFNNAYNAQLINLPGGVVDVQGDYNFSPNGSQSGLQIVNQGTFRKSAGSGILTLQIPFVNSGQLDILSGTFSLQSSLLLNASGTMNGSVILNGSTLSGTLRGMVNWVGGGTFNGLLTVASNSVLSLDAIGNKFFDGVITNAGTVTLTNNGYLLFNNADNAQLINLPGGLVDVQGDFNFFSNGSPSGLQIVNQGTFLKSAGSGICAISSGIPFYNSGSVVAFAGTLSFDSSFINSGGGLFIRLNSATQSGKMAFANPLALSGPFSVSLLPGFTPDVGTTFSALSFPSFSGGFTAYYGLDLGNGRKLVPTLEATSLKLLVSTYDPETPPTLSQFPFKDSILFWWPETYSGYQVFSATNLLSPVWMPVAETGLNQLLIAPSKPQEYFRLAR